MLGGAITAGTVTPQLISKVKPSWNVFPHRVVGAQRLAVGGYFLVKNIG